MRIDIVDNELSYVIGKIARGIKAVKHIDSQSFKSQVMELRYIFDSMISDIQEYSDKRIKYYEKTFEEDKP